MSPASGDAVREAARRLRTGGLVAFPTDTLYALGCMAGDVAGRRRFYEAKRRSTNRPAVVMARYLADLERWVEISPRARELADEFWPGPLTMVLKATNEAIKAFGPVVSKGTLGVRIPDHGVALALLAAVDAPVATSSANPAGEKPPTTAGAVRAQFGATVDVVLDGDCQIGIASTIVDLTHYPPQLIREGSVPADRVLR